MREIEEYQMNVFENTFIPFDKRGSQYIEIDKENPYWAEFFADRQQ